LLVTPVAFLLVLAFTASPIVKTIAQTEDVKKVQIIEELQTADPQEEDVFTVVEDMPKFQGGTQALMQFLTSNITYPKEARLSGTQGTVYVQFVIEKDGSVSDVNILRGFDKACDAEALRVLSTMPNWIPGKQRGTTVRVQYNLPIKFTLDNEKKIEKGADTDKTPPPPPPPPKNMNADKSKGTPPPPPEKEIK